MKKIHLYLLFSLFTLTASSQQVYFVYIQTETGQPFFVKVKEKNYSSSAAGFLILSKLVDSNYSIKIGFPQGKWPEQNFLVPINKRDHGYLLKNFGTKGWGLFDLQTLSVQMAISGKTNIEYEPKGEIGEVSAFTEILSKAADDPSLREKPVLVKPEEKKTEVGIQEVPKKDSSVVTGQTKPASAEPVTAKPTEVVEVPVARKENRKKAAKDIPIIVETTRLVEVNEQPLEKKDTPGLSNESKTEIKESVEVNPVEAKEQPVEKKEEIKTEIKEQPGRSTEETKTVAADSYKASQVKKWSESSTTEGFGLVFIDDYENGVKDTIRLVIPNPKPVVHSINDQPKEEKKFLDINTEPSKKNEASAVSQAKVTHKKRTQNQTPAQQIILSNNCTEVASESTFSKLRKKMVSSKNEEGKISEAKKYFKSHCFSTEQIKNLIDLFLFEEGKYNFLDAAYKYVSDLQDFNSLQIEFKDEYYASRFKAMLRN